MDIEKIKNYNQTMLAVVSTLSVILLLILIISLIPELQRLFGGTKFSDNPSGLIAENNTAQLNQENLRKQIISYGSPWLVDTLKSGYIIPVSITTLKKPELIPPPPELHSTIAYEGYDFNTSKGYYYNKGYFGRNYANLIIYYSLENRIIPLFTERIVIGNIQAYYFKDDILLIFYSSEKDTNKDGIITLDDDTRSLCIYSLKTEMLKKISDDENSIYQYQFIGNTKDLLIEFNLSQYNEKQFNNSETPSKIMRYDYNSQSLTNIIPQKILTEMQKLVEGK